ncbi:MAG: hypothetical protein AAGL11_01835 [Pseudomonadota bacterium]
MRLLISPALAGVIMISACGDSTPMTEELSGTQATEAVTQGSVTTSKNLSGTLYFTYVDPLEAPRAMALNLKSKKYRVVSSGIRPAVEGETIAYVDFCNPLSVRVAVTDPDGFTNPIAECIERETITEEDYRWPAISPDGELIAITNFQVGGEYDAENDPYGLDRIAGLNLYTATQVYNLNGELQAEFRDMGPATWTRNGRLLLAGRGGDVGYGIFEANKAMSATKRIDDGRLRDVVSAMDAHPKKDELAFIFNGQLFEMPLSSGKAKRIHQHGHPLAGLSYSPDGKQIAIISTDNLEEGFDMPGSGYPIFIYDNGKVHNVMLPFATSAPLDWTK